eukprot:4233023-Pyramimonas_sp.AAC.1
MAYLPHPSSAHSSLLIFLPLPLAPSSGEKLKAPPFSPPSLPSLRLGLFYYYYKGSAWTIGRRAKRSRETTPNDSRA